MKQSDAAPTKRVDVAVAVVFNEHGQVLWGSRPQGKPYAGYWEFPGGKVEPHESIWQALVRELKEELGIVAKEGARWFLIEHDYEHAKVRLHLYRVWSFEGEPQPLEGQEFRWGRLDTDEVAPILPATAPLLPVLAQTDFILISDYARIGRLAMESRLDKAMALTQGRFRLIFREKSLSDTQQLLHYRHAENWCLTKGVELLLNSDSAKSLAGLANVSGLKIHLTEYHLQSRPESLANCIPLGASVHSHEGLEMAHSAGLQYAVLGSVQETRSHPGSLGMGWGGFQSLVAGAKLPVFAVGGLNPADMSTAKKHGAHGLAMINGIDLP